MEHSGAAAPSAANKWLVALAVMLATLIEVLDMTIANVALDHIRGSLSAGVDEAAWVLTSYIVANAIVIPLSGWLGNLFGRKRFFTACILLFTVSSFLCGAAPNLESLVFFRVLQGLAGGSLMPISQAILMETFPPKEQAMAMAVWGLGMMVGPVLGPILGGWITDNYSWRWIFFINLPFGTLAAMLVTFILHDAHYVSREIKRIDWWGLILLVLGVGSLQIMLDKGERADWFNSNLIVCLAIMAVVGLCAFVIHELRSKEPVVDLHVFNNRSFAVGTMFTTAIMFGMYGTFALIPLYCQLVAGYTPILSGEVLSVQTCGTFLSVLVAGRLYHRFDPRYLVCLGCIVAGIGAWDMTHFNPSTGFWEIARPGFLRGMGSGFIFIPLTTIALGSVPRERMSAASGLFNMVRTLGGGIGIALLIAFLSQGAQIHQSHLVGHIHNYNPELWRRFALATSSASLGMTDSATIGQPFLSLVYGEVQRQALLMSFVDDFRILAFIFFLMSPVVFLMRRPQAPGAVAAH